MAGLIFSFISESHLATFMLQVVLGSYISVDFLFGTARRVSLFKSVLTFFHFHVTVHRDVHVTVHRDVHVTVHRDVHVTVHRDVHVTVHRDVHVTVHRDEFPYNKTN
jgi:hypothetical protein